MFDDANNQQEAGALVRRDDAAIARATQEIQAALVIGQKFPRDEIKAKAKILEACKRKGLAELAEYEYSRGGTRITGPTVDLLRAIANRWGNVRFGWRETERSNGQSTVRCEAWDTQTNGYAYREFVVTHWRDTQQGGYKLENERDIYELLANMAARRVRACLEEVIDQDIIEAAVQECRNTLRTGEKTPLKDRAVAMLMAFEGEFGVTKEMLEARIGNGLEAISENQLASLRRVFKSLKDGVGKREDYFKPVMAKPVMEGAATAGNESQPAQEKTQSSGQPPTGQNLPSQPGEALNAPQSDSDQGGATQTPPAAQMPAPAPAAQPDSSLKALRANLAAAKMKPKTLLDHLAAEGITDGSPTSLEELQLSFPSIVKTLVKQWADFHHKMTGES